MLHSHHNLGRLGTLTPVLRFILREHRHCLILGRLDLMGKRAFLPAGHREAIHHHRGGVAGSVPVGIATEF